MQNVLERNALHPVKVLIVEDSSDDVLLITDALRSDGFEPSWKQVATSVETRVALKNESWDLVIADHRLPGFNALEAFQNYVDSGLDIPFIIVSGLISEEEVVAAMKAGVHDYISKGSLARLAPAVIRELREAQTRRERKRAEYALRAVHEELAAIYANAPIALLVVDEELRIRKANEMAARLAERDVFDMVDLRPGRAFGCQNSFENEQGCGYSRSCFHCTLRLAALDTLKNGTRHSDIEKNLSVVRDGETRLICLLFSIVPLRVDNTKLALICAQDITNIKQANTEIESQHEQ
jgi:DNA-binding response OmpR family regulator